MQGERLATFDINEVSLTFAGILLGDSPAVDTLTVESDGASYGYVKGANGSVCRYAMNERVIKIKYKVLGSSSDNQKLSAQLTLDEASGTGAGVGAILLKDNNGASLYAGPGWIEGLPANAIGQQRGDVEWTLVMVRKVGSAVVGGN